MQKYPFGEKNKFNGIYAWWCLGYLKREEQLEFLKNAKKSLDNKPGNYRKSKGPASYIIVYDNIDKEESREKPLEKKGQTV